MAFDLLEDCVQTDGSNKGALNDLAVGYSRGIVGKVERNEGRCIDLLRRSSDLGLALATFNLGMQSCHEQDWSKLGETGCHRASR